VITLNNFYDQRVFTPRNNKRRIIRVDGSSICFNQLSVHFRNMSRSSRCRVYGPWWSTRLRLTSKANRWLHKSCASSTTQDHEIKTTLTNVQMSWTITSIRSSMPHYPDRIPGLRDFSSGVTVPTLNPVSPLITGLHFTLPTCVNFTIFSKY